MAVREYLLAFLNIFVAMARAILMAFFLLLHVLLKATEQACWHVETFIDSRCVAKPDPKSLWEDKIIWVCDRISRYAWRATMEAICIMNSLYMGLTLDTHDQAPGWIQSAMQYYRDHKHGPTADFNIN